MYLSLHSTYGNGTLRTSILHIAIAGIALGACDLEYQSMSSETNSVGVSEIETKGTTSVSDPAWSPDGRMIAYAASKPYIEALRLDLSNADIAREAAIQGLPGQPYPNLYSFSPDGKKLLYTAADDNIWMADLVSRTSKIFLAEKQLSQFAWSQNGQWIAYRKAGRIWLIKSSGDENHRLRGTLHADSQPAPSPDGSTVAFIGQRGSSQSAGYSLWITDSRNDSLWQVTPDTVEPSSPHWAPDGGRLVFQYASSDSVLIATISPDGTGIRRISRGFHRGYEPKWSPDGSTIAFFDLYDKVWLADPDGDNLTETEVRVIDHIDWHPDGRSLLSYRNTNIRNIDAVSMEDFSVIHVTAPEEAMEDGTPCWLPDARSVIFTRTDTTFDRPRLFKTITGQNEAAPLMADETFLNFGHSNISPAVSNDGKWLLFNDSGTYIYLASLDDNSVVRINPYLNSYVYSASWGPDNHSAVFTSASVNALSIFTVDTTLSIQRTDIIPPEGTRFYTPAWSRKWAGGTAFIAAGSNAGIYVMNADGSDQKLVVPDAAQPVWSPDAARLAYISDHRLYVLEILGKTAK